MTGEGDAVEGACDAGTVARKAGKKSGEGDRSILRTAALRGHRRRYGAYRGDGRTLPELEIPQARKDFGKDKNKKCHNGGCGIS